MKKVFVSLSCLCCILAGCASGPSHVNTENLSDLQNVEYSDLQSAQVTVSSIRQKALRDIAMSMGAQSGLAVRSKQINKMVLKNSNELSRIFNFNAMLMDHNVLPPVLDQSYSSLNLTDNDTIQIADHTYRIVKQARFVTTAPTWRDYLLMNYKKPQLPDRTLLPRNSDERDIWEKYITLGWQQGIQQANAIYQDNLAKLRRDYEGMMLYKNLLNKNMVSRPYVAHASMGVTSNSDHTEMKINDRVLRITALPKLQVQSIKWKPVIVQDNG